MHPVEDIGISPSPVDVVEFGADAYAHREQVDDKQLYNQVPQTAWGNCSWSQLGDKMPAWESACRRRAWALGDPRFSSPARMRKKCCYGQKNLGSICTSLPPSPTHLSHTTNINPFENKVWEVYFYKKVCSFVLWSRHYCWLCFHLYLYMYMYVAMQHIFNEVKTELDESKI